ACIHHYLAYMWLILWDIFVSLLCYPDDALLDTRHCSWIIVHMYHFYTCTGGG
ncbi:hypothetical protein CSUI_007029, partial [Cystoisospora suis]